MRQKKHELEEIVAELRQVDVLLSQGGRWRGRQADRCDAVHVLPLKEFGGLKSDQVKRLKELEKENERLGKAVSEAKVIIERWRQHDNTIRLHSALGYRPPAPAVALWPAA